MNIHTDWTLEKMSVSSKSIWRQEAVYVFHYYKKTTTKNTDKAQSRQFTGELEYGGIIHIWLEKIWLLWAADSREVKNPKTKSH